jgi:hypothetical protein
MRNTPAEQATGKKPKQKHQLTRAAMVGAHAKNASATKKGPGRFHQGGEPGNRLKKQKPLRAYRALMAYFASKRTRHAGNARGQGLL